MPRTVCNVNWLVHPGVSCFHTVTALLMGYRLRDPAWELALEEGLSEFRGQLDQEHRRSPVVLRNLAPLAAEADGRQLGEMLYKKGAGRTTDPQAVMRIGLALSRLQTRFQQVLPPLDSQATINNSMLVEHWSTRGDELLANIVRQTEPNVVLGAARVVLVHPTTGSGGFAHPWFNLVRFEAAPARPLDDLPEVVQLAWLIACLTLRLPAYGEHLGIADCERTVALALIPATLAAAEECGLASAQPDLIYKAVCRWMPRTDQPVDLYAQPLQTWWEIYDNRRPTWPVALQALNRLLNEAEEEAPT